MPVCGGFLLLALGAAGKPAVFDHVSGGNWEIAGQGVTPARMCVSEPQRLALYPVRKARCTRTIIRDDGQSALITYSCANGTFGQSNVTVLTPRSLRIETQGISGGEPFKLLIQARRIGNCGPH